MRCVELYVFSVTGRIEYLLSDKTGTLTQNEMVFKKLHLGTVSFTSDTMDEVCLYASIKH